MKKIFDNPCVCFFIAFIHIVAAIGAPAYLFHIDEAPMAIFTIVLDLMALPEFIRCVKVMLNNSGKKKEEEKKEEAPKKK